MDEALKEIPPELLDWVLQETEGKLPERCIICDAEPYFSGLWIHAESKQAFIYSLCRVCLEKPETPGILKKVIRYYASVENGDLDLILPCGEC